LIPGKQYRPEDFLRVAWRRKWLIALPLVVSAAATMAYVYSLPNLYRSGTLILIVPQRVPESYVQSTVTMKIEDRLQSISQQILIRPRLERVIDDFNLYPELRKTAIMEDVVERMRREIAVQVVKGDAFRVSYVSGEPRTSQRVTERLASLFIEENLRDREVLAEGTNQFLEAELEDARRRLVDNEKKLAEYRRLHANEMPTHLEANLQGQHNAELQLQALANALNIDRDRRRTLERQLGDLLTPSASGEPSPALQGVSADPTAAAQTTAAAQLAVAQSNLSAMELRLKPEHPDVIRARHLMAELEKKAAEEASVRPVESGEPRSPTLSERARESRLAELRLDLESLGGSIASKEEQEQQLRASIATYQSRVQAVPMRETELVELTRDYDTIRQLYQGLLGKYEASKISANLERRQQSEQFRVLEPASLPEKPFSPDRIRLNLMGAAFGLALGLALAALLEYFDTSMRTESDVLVALALPVLALVPHVVGEGERRRRRRRLVWGLTAATTVVTALAAAVWMLRL
jgi:polysaccharide chain length determinant protein (PEP-CTERM system associated)